MSVNSSLQRARARVGEAGVRPEGLDEPSAAEQRAWVDRYMKAFVNADIEGLKRLLTEDVLMEMPPMINWFVGPDNYGLFMEWVFAKGGTEWRLRPVEANGQPGFAAYGRVDGGYELHTLQIFTVTADGISRNSVFRDFDVFASFGLATALDADQVPVAIPAATTTLAEPAQRRRTSSSRRRDEFRSRRRYVLTRSPEHLGRTDHKGESDVRQSCRRRGRHPGRTGCVVQGVGGRRRRRHGRQLHRGRDRHHDRLAPRQP